MIHIVGFPHTRFDERVFAHCAYTTKVVRWVEMMAAEGEEMTVYWGGDRPPTLPAGVSDYVSVMTDDEQSHFFGQDLPGMITALDWDPRTEPWVVLNHRVAAALYARITGPDDVICILSGSNHDTLMEEFRYVKFLEPWVGYVGISPKSYAKVYESSAWRHLLAGQHNIQDGQPFDVVIPNYYRPDDFAVGPDDGYLLYVGRMIKRKGIEDAVRIARRSGRHLVMAGQGARRVSGGEIVCQDGTVLGGPGIDYLGVVGPDQRRDLYAHASATLVPTLYWEPFGGVFAEAMLSGVVPVCRDWGAFVEYTPDRARFSTVDQGVEALEWAVSRRGEQVRDSAIERFSTDACAKRFAEWLGRVRQ